MICRFPSLEIGWLQRSEKWMSLPDVAVMDHSCPEMSGGACYCPPRTEPLVVDGQEIQVGRGGLIVLKSDQGCCPEDIEYAAIIAHEWRHSWQHQSGVRLDGRASKSLLQLGLPYEATVRRYFREMPTERDALWFQWIKTHSPLSEYWVGLASA